MVSRPPPLPSPTNCVGEGERHKSRRSGIEFSSPPCSSGGRGRERGGARGRSAMPFDEPPTCRLRPPPQTPRGRENGGKARRSGIEFPSPPCSSGGRGRERGGARGRSAMPFDEPPTCRLRPPPQTAWGRENGGNLVAAGPNSPLPPAVRGGEAGRGGGARGRSAMPFDEPPTCRLRPPPQTAWGRENGGNLVAAGSNSPLPPAVRGGEAGRGGAPADAARCRSTSLQPAGSALPSPRGTSGEGPGEGPLADAVRFPSPRRVHCHPVSRNSPSDRPDIPHDHRIPQVQRIRKGEPVHGVRDPRDDAAGDEVRRGEPGAGVPRLRRAGAHQAGRHGRHRQRREPVRHHLGRARLSRGAGEEDGVAPGAGDRPRARDHRHLRRHRGDDRHADGYGGPRRGGGDLRAVLRELRARRHPLRREARLREAAPAHLELRPRRAARGVHASGPRPSSLCNPNNPVGKVFTREEMAVHRRTCAGSTTRSASRTRSTSTSCTRTRTARRRSTSAWRSWRGCASAPSSSTPCPRRTR